MKTMIMLFALLTTTHIHSQTIEPTAHRFNWGTYTAPFHDTSHKQTRMVMGWQWGGNDSSFNRFIGVNANHDHNQNADFWHSKYNDDTVKQIYELDAIKVVGITSRYDGEILSNLSSTFQTNVYDSTGAVFGWSNRNNSIVSNDTATQTRARGFAVLQGNTTGLALSDCRPKNLLSRVGMENTYSTRRRKMYLSVALRRSNTLSSDTSQNSALTIKLKYWAHGKTNSSTDTTFQEYIKFDSIASNVTWTDRGYRNTQVRSRTNIEDTTEFIVPRNLLPLDSTNIVREPTVTLSAVFILDSILNPRLRYENEDYNIEEKGFHIDSMDVEVYYQGFPLKLDYVCIRDSIDYELQNGTLDTLILNHVQNRITQYHLYQPNVKLWRISVNTEFRASNARSIRYISKLFNGFTTSSYGFDYPTHIMNIINQKDYWSFGVVTGVGSSTAAPWIAHLQSDSIACWNYPTNYVCGGKPSVMGYHHDKRAWSDGFSNFGDTTKSFYETFVSIWNNGNHIRYATRNEIQSFDTMDVSSFLNAMYDQRAYLTINEVNYCRYRNLYGEFSYLYQNKPWWAQKQLHTIYKLKYHFPDTIHYDPLGEQISTEYLRAKTGEEIRYMLYEDIILGCKGIMIDNGTYYPYGTLGYGLYLTLRKTGEAGTQYNSNSIWDTDYWKRNDSTKINQYINPQRVIRLWGNEDTNRVYLGTKSARLEVKKIWAFMNQNNNELMRLRLLSWISKGFKTYYSGDTTNFSRAIKIQKDSVLVRPIGRLGWDNKPLYEPRDSTFFDITLLRDSSDNSVMLDSVFYIGVCNKRTDPLRYIRYPFNDTVSPKRLLFLSSAEYEDSCRVSKDSTRWRELKYSQLGAREITIPFNYSHSDGKNHVLRVQEIDGSLDTVIGSHSKLPIVLLPGEGRIYRITIPTATANAALGDVQNSNQRKLICYPKVQYDNLSNTFKEQDTVYYHMCYHRIDSVDNRSKVYYRRSVPSIRGHVPIAGLQWQNEICLSQQPIIKLNDDTTTMNAAYPSIVVRNDSVNRIPRVYVVFACEDNNTDLHYSIAENTLDAQAYTQVAFPARQIDTAIGERYNNGVRRGTLEFLSLWGAPTVNASAYGNYYAWTDSVRGIVARWKQPNDTLFATTNTTQVKMFSNSLEFLHPSLNTYSRIGLSENECALVWEERGAAQAPLRHIYYTRLNTNQTNIWNFLPDNMDPNFGMTCVVNADTSIAQISDATDGENHEYPMVYRAVEEFPVDTNHLNGNHNLVWRRNDRVVWQSYGETGFSSYGLFINERGISSADSILTTVPSLWWVYDPLKIYSTISDLYSPQICQGQVNSDGFYNKSDSALSINFTNYQSGAYTTREVYQYNTDLWFNGATKSLTTSSEIQWVANAGESRLSAQNKISSSYDWIDNRRIYYPGTYDNSTITSSVELFAKQTVDEHSTPLFFNGFSMNGRKMLFSQMFTGQKQIQLHPSVISGNSSGIFRKTDTVYSDWFTVNNALQLKIFSYGYDLPCVRLWIQEKSNKNELLAVPLRTNNRKERFKNNVLLQRGGNKEFRMIIVSECRGFTKPINDIDLFGNTPDNLSKATENNETIEIDLHQEFIGGSAITVYPNPSDNKLNITFSGFDDANNSLLLKYDVNVLDILGKTVDKQQIRTGETISINTVDLPEGIYFVQVKGFYTSSYQPVIIKR